jgi:hypothetical protein
MEAFLGLGFLAEVPWDLEVHFFQIYISTNPRAIFNGGFSFLSI